jgi:threonine/homoserine/homoserine lactone efflux protein
MEYTYGATVAFGLLLAVSAMLNTMLLTFLPKILLVMQIIGTIYMFYLAYQIYKMDTSASPTVNQAGTFASGFFMQFVNPKVILFTMTVIPSNVLPFDTSMPAVALSAFTITLIGFFAFVTWVLFGTIFKQFLQAHKKIVNVIMALFLGFAAIVMWM